METAILMVAGISLVVGLTLLKRLGKLESDIQHLSEDWYVARLKAGEIQAASPKAPGVDARAEEEPPVAMAPSPPNIPPKFAAPPSAPRPKEEPTETKATEKVQGDTEGDTAPAKRGQTGGIGDVLQSLRAVPATAAERITKARGAEQKEAAESLEQRIGTKWVLVAGIIAIMVGAGLFLKYAYDTSLIGPVGRVLITTMAGVIALVVGRLTRRRGYEIVAKGMTALGFALLYASVFSAHSYYHLYSATTAFALSIVVTAAAMFYAVRVDEILAAFIALLGGFVAPLLLSSGENQPVVMLGYVSILSVGAMLSAIFRKWRAVNLLAFVGSFALYNVWFERFYRPATVEGGANPQMAIALVWVATLFVIFLVLPILYELIKRVDARKEDVVLIVMNATMVFYGLASILLRHSREWLALAAVGLAVAHLGMKILVSRRHRQDAPLRLILLIIGLFFVTVAVPLYLRMYAVAMAWAGQGLILTAVGIKYRSVVTRASAMVALALSCVWLAAQLPLHEVGFNLVLNREFASWCFVAGTLYGGHLMYRRMSGMVQEQAKVLAQSYYGVAWLLLLGAVVMEWHFHLDLNLFKVGRAYHESFSHGSVVIGVAFMVLLVLRPVSPAGEIWKMLAVISGAAVLGVTLLYAARFYDGPFTIFANGSFLVRLLGVVGIFAVSRLLRRTIESSKLSRDCAYTFSLAAAAALWILLTQELYFYWQCRGIATSDIVRCRFLGQMYISVAWAIYAASLMIVGFWRKWTVLRYISLSLFMVVLIKVFIFDISKLENVYRIAGFVVLGVTLLGMSYLYQYGVKKGFFANPINQLRKEG